MKNTNYMLYDDEKTIVDNVKKKLVNYGHSNKEKIQKQNELFHLLCFMYLDNNKEMYYKVKPNEPGDFILIDNNKKIMIEVVECFGNNSTYIEIKNKMNKLFNRVNLKNNIGIYKFTIDECKEKFNSILLLKNKKQYLNNSDFDKKILLIVTGEYDNCPATGNWIIKFLKDEDFLINLYDEIWILDYFSSSKDLNPTIIKNPVDEIRKYNNILNSDSN